MRFKPIYTLLQCQFIPLTNSPWEQEGCSEADFVIGLVVKTRMVQMQGSKPKQEKHSVYSFERGRSEEVPGKPQRPRPSDEP